MHAHGSSAAGTSPFVQVARPAQTAQTAQTATRSASRLGRDISSLLVLAIPIVAGLVCSAAMGVVDSAVIAPLGAAALGAVSLTGSVMLIFIAALYGFLSPVGVLAAQAYGARDANGVARQHAAAWRLSTVAGVAAATTMLVALAVVPLLGQPDDVIGVLAPYWVWSALSLVPLSVLLAYKQLFDAIDRPWPAVLVMLGTVFANATLSVWLVGGGAGVPPLGLAGAGIGSFIAQLGGTVALIVVGGTQLESRRWLHGERTWRNTFAAQRREGTPMGLHYLLETGANAVAGLLVGTFGAAALAAQQITMSVTMALYMLPLGIAAAAGLRIAQAVGAGDRTSCWPLAKAALGIATVWMVLSSVGLALSGRGIALLFGADVEVAAAAGVLAIALGLTQIADGAQSVSLGALRGLLDSRWPTRVSLVCYWLLALPAAWLLGLWLGIGPAGVWAGFGLGLVVAAMALTRRLRRLTRAPAAA